MNKPISKSDALKIAVTVGIETPKDEIDNFDAAQGHYWDECDTCEEVERLKLENIQLAHDLGECMAEREELRKTLGQVLDVANELKRIGSLYGVD